MGVKIALIGKTNAGKTTIFNTVTGRNEPIGNYMFTTQNPVSGTTYVTSPCVHKEFGVIDNPINSKCIDGWRYIPIEIIDLPGLIKGASYGRGLGTRFLSEAMKADAFIHVVDASGSIDEDGRIAEPGTGDPFRDYQEIEGEIVQWYKNLLENNLDKILKKIETTKNEQQAINVVYETLAGVKITKLHIIQALEDMGVSVYDFRSMSDEKLWRLASLLRDISKPTLIVANKMDIPVADSGFKQLKDKIKDKIIVPVSANLELLLKRAEQKGTVRYNPAEENFLVIDSSNLSKDEKKALDFFNKFLIREMMRAGTQFALNVAVFKLLRMNVVYPVADPKKLSDKKGNVLPDAYLVPDGSTVKDLAEIIHSELAVGLLYAIDIRTGLRLPPTYRIKDRDVLHLVSATRKSK
ncbi:MAG: YchF-related putative GTPase [Nitrososphaeria archaeon]|jgi:ribosome-binding ATPase YchF (GTP1/OBG family)